MYQGLLAEQVFDLLSGCDPHLYTAGDFADFVPNPSQVRSTRFMHATVTAHGSNSPWKELFLLLKIYQLSAQDTTLLTPAQLCTAAGLIDTWLAARHIRHIARHRASVPAEFAPKVPLAAHQKAADYTVAKTRLGLVGMLWGGAVLIGFAEPQVFRLWA